MANQPLYCTPDQFEQLLELVKNAGYKLLGPKLRDEVILYEELLRPQKADDAFASFGP